jgi:periplasmic protein TonB
MFDDMVLSGKSKPTHKRWTVILSTAVQALILGIMILIPLIYTEALPKQLLSTFLVAPPPPPPPPPPAAAPVKVVRPKIIPTQSMVAPKVIPKTVAIIKDEAPDLAGGTDGGFGVAGGTGLGGALGGILGAPPPPKPATPQRIRVGGSVQAAKMLRQTPPVYPQIAKTAHVSGTVVLHAVIAKDGTVQELTYVSGPPLLMKAAMDAVRDWRYTPTTLNGDPVEVDTTISVVFQLGG